MGCCTLQRGRDLSGNGSISTDALEANRLLVCRSTLAKNLFLALDPKPYQVQHTPYCETVTESTSGGSRFANKIAAADFQLVCASTAAGGRAWARGPSIGERAPVKVAEGCFGLPQGTTATQEQRDEEERNKKVLQWVRKVAAQVCDTDGHLLAQCGII